MPPTDLAAIGDKFLSGKSGWFDTCSFKLVALAPKYQPLFGDVRGPKST